MLPYTLHPMMQCTAAKRGESSSLKRQTNASDEQEISTNLVKVPLKMVILVPTAAMRHCCSVQLTS